MFFTVVKLPKSNIDITYKNKILTLGSCFSNNMGEKLQNAFFSILTNPFGVLYNPISIKNALQLLTSNALFDEKDLFQHHSLWNSFYHSSHFSNSNQKQCLTNINSELIKARTFFQETDFLFITFGTAWVFEHKKNQQIVSNCHKLPISDFNRYRLSVTEIVKTYKTLLQNIHTDYPNLKIVFTVSPIRHWKDGAHENTLSKSTLQLAISELQDRFSFVHYFPAYEIMLDELRDYRFYSADMIHLNQVAIDYLWQRFSELYFSQSTNNLKKELEKLQKMLQHKPRNNQTEEYKIFKNNIETKKQYLIEKYPFLKKQLTF